MAPAHVRDALHAWGLVLGPLLSRRMGLPDIVVVAVLDKRRGTDAAQTLGTLFFRSWDWAVWMYHKPCFLNGENMNHKHTRASFHFMNLIIKHIESFMCA